MLYVSITIPNIFLHFEDQKTAFLKIEIVKDYLNMDKYTDNINMDKNGIIYPDYYKNAIQDEINNIIIEWSINPDKININQFNGIFNEIGNRLFKNTSDYKPNNKQANIPYNENNFTILLNIYKNICFKYNLPMSMYGFSLLIHTSEETIKKYVTTADLEIINNRREYTRNKLFDNNLGITVLANNDTSVGLLYTRQNAIETQAIKTGLSLSDLKPITDNSL